MAEISQRESGSISVVIPAYNAAHFIAETLQSIFNQTLPPDEIIVVDDGSTDDTAHIAENFGDRVKVFRIENIKQAAARNFGVAQATGEWIAFLDADDLWLPKKLERQMAQLSRHPEADICYTGRIERRAKKRGKRVRVASPKSIRGALFRNTCFLPSSVVIRRSTYLAVGGFDPHFRLVQDWDLWLRLLHAGVKFAACKEPLVNYRIHLKNATYTHAIEALEAKEEIFLRHVLPYLPMHTRWFRHNQARSEHEACAAAVLQEVRDPRDLHIMIKSILRSPFYDAYRYKRLARMLYARLKSATYATNPQP